MIGEKIRDIEDGDCYYEGIVVSLNPIKYEITNIVWCGEIDDSMNGEIIELKWWILEIYKNNSWVSLS
jgi:hypothetical protein